MDFDLKISRLCNQEEVDKYPMKYGFRLNPGIKVKFCPHGVSVSLAPLGDGVYMHPKLLVLGLRLTMMRFIRNVLSFYRVTLLSYWEWPDAWY